MSRRNSVQLRTTTMSLQPLQREALYPQFFLHECHTTTSDIQPAVGPNSIKEQRQATMGVSVFLVASSSDGREWCADDDTMSGCKVEQQSRWRQLRKRDKKTTKQHWVIQFRSRRVAKVRSKAGCTRIFALMSRHRWEQWT